MISVYGREPNDAYLELGDFVKGIAHLLEVYLHTQLSLDLIVRHIRYECLYLGFELLDML